MKCMIHDLSTTKFKSSRIKNTFKPTQIHPDHQIFHSSKMCEEFSSRMSKNINVSLLCNYNEQLRQNDTQFHKISLIIMFYLCLIAS